MSRTVVWSDIWRVSPVTIASDTGTIDALGSGPMAVLPASQHLGIGSQLVGADNLRTLWGRPRQG